MRPISRIYVSCYKADYWLAEICITSIRYWYPQIPVSLIVDYSAGAFDTRRVERAWDVDVVPLERRVLKFYGRIEICFRPIAERFLYLDADIALAGPVFERLESHATDFLVSGDMVDNPYAGWLKDLYYDYTRLLEYDKEFTFPGFVFNSGQFVGEAGMIHRSDFDGIIEWSSPPRILIPEVMWFYDQSVLNYMLPRLAQAGRITLSHCPFKRNPNDPTLNVDLDAIKGKRGEPYVIHWCGIKSPRLSTFPKGEVLEFYQELFWERIGASRIVRQRETASRIATHYALRTKKRAYSMLPERVKSMWRARRARRSVHGSLTG